MNNTRSKEYDAFGPWIYVINDEHTLPPLFEKYQQYVDEALMMFKIPRQIERRNANPNMHLYDSVVGIFKTNLLVLDRVENSVMERRIQLRNVQAIKKTTNLLSGELVLYTNSATVTIPYNTVSDDVMTRAAGLIRSLQHHKYVDLNLPPMAYDIKTIEFLYVHLINDLKKDDPNTELIAYQPSIELEGKRNVFAKILNWIFNRRLLQCSAFVTNGHELIVIERSASVKSNKTPDYAYSYVYLPLEYIGKASIEPHPKEQSLNQLIYGTKNYTFISAFNDNNTGIDALCKCLRAQSERH